jgi:hypothetical protein
VSTPVCQGGGHDEAVQPIPRLSFPGESFLREVARVLKPAGHFIAHLPIKASNHYHIWPA